MATQRELFKESNKIAEVEFIAADDINAPDLSKLAADMATQTESFKDPSDETTELEVTTSDDVTASPLPPLKSVIGTAMRTTAKMVVDTTAQTDHSFPPNQGVFRRRRALAFTQRRSGSALSLVAVSRFFVRANAPS
jgi:hypothetical protein